MFLSFLPVLWVGVLVPGETVSWGEAPSRSGLFSVGVQASQVEGAKACVCRAAALANLASEEGVWYHV